MSRFVAGSVYLLEAVSRSAKDRGGSLSADGYRIFDYPLSEGQAIGLFALRTSDISDHSFRTGYGISKGYDQGHAEEDIG